MAGVMTIALLNPVQTWSDSFVGDVPVSEEPLIYGTTSPDAAVGSDEQFNNAVSVPDNETQAGNEQGNDEGEKAPAANSEEGSGGGTSDVTSDDQPDSSTPKETGTTDDSGQTATDSSQDTTSSDSGQDSSTVDDSSDTSKDTTTTPTPPDESMTDSSVAPEVTESITPSGTVTPTISGEPTVSPTVTPTAKPKVTKKPTATPKPTDSADKKEYTLRIEYVNMNGDRVADIYYQSLRYGESFNIQSPTINGYTAGLTAITGTITGDVVYRVTYTVDAAPVPTPRATYTVRTTGQAYNAASTYTQKMVNPELAGFAKISKKYALAKCDSFLNVREGKGYKNRIVGVLYPNNLCYIIEDTDSKWVYIESGTVRGFVDKQYLLTGKKANAYVKKQGEDKLTLAKQIIAPSSNTAFRYILKTVREIPTSVSYRSASTTADRQAMVSFSEQFLGNPYVWGGESLTEGCDCSGFTMLIYRQFGIELPRCSYEQAEVGTKIAAQDALPGDLLFYARDGAVYHVLMYIGNGQAINASSSTTGIIISNVDYNKTCWGVRVIEDTPSSSTQASSLVEIGQRAYNGDESAQQQIIEALGTATQEEWTQYGMLPSVVIAQVIQESGWLSFSGAANGGIQPEDNNILGMNEELLNDQWESPWTGTAAMRNVPQWDGEKDVYGEESMRTYEDIEACLSDYAAFKTGIHPEIKNETDVDTVIDIGLEGYATDPTYEESIGNIIDKYDLTRYDTIAQMGTSPTDPTNYTQEELELIWAIVAQEDDTGYEGALAVISSAMNRADANYGGYGTTALEQLTADGQYCYSPKVSDPSLYQRRLGGNVDDFVIQAVTDCLTKGVRNNTYLNFRSSNRTGEYVQIGGNWYF